MNLQIYIHKVLPKSLQLFWDRVEASDAGSRMASGAFWSICGAVISRGSMLLASILIARILGREVYGEYGILRTTVNMFLVFAGFGLGMTATKYVAEFRLTDPARTGRILAISGLFATCTGTLVAAVMYMFAPWVATHTINAPHLSGELKVGALVLFLNALNGAQTGALAGFEAFKITAMVNLGVGLASFPILVGGAYFGGLRGAVWALGAIMLVNWLLNHIALRHQVACHNVPFTSKGCFKELPILWRFSLPAVLSGIMVSPVMWICNAVLVNQPDGYGQMGLFDAANQWVAAILFIPGMIGQIVLPILSNLNGLSDRAKYRKIIYYNVILNGGVSFAIALPIAILAPFIMRSYGAKFEQGAPVLVLLCVCSVLISMNNVIGQAIASKSKMWNGLFLNALWATTLLISSFFLIRLGYGAIGLAFANLIAYLLHSFFVTVYAFKLIGGVAE